MSTKYDIEHAIQVAKLWRAGKMIGGDEDEVREALLDEVLSLREIGRELFAADDAYGCGFYGTSRWRAAYDNLRAALQGVQSAAK